MEKTAVWTVYGNLTGVRNLAERETYEFPGFELYARAVRVRSVFPQRVVQIAARDARGRFGGRLEVLFALTVVVVVTILKHNM